MEEGQIKVRGQDREEGSLKSGQWSSNLCSTVVKQREAASPGDCPEQVQRDPGFQQALQGQQAVVQVQAASRSNGGQSTACREHPSAEAV